MAPEERPVVGQLANQVRQVIESKLTERQEIEEIVLAKG